MKGGGEVFKDILPRAISVVKLKFHPSQPYCRLTTLRPPALPTSTSTSQME
jgi:hypothetical protein